MPQTSSFALHGKGLAKLIRRRARRLGLQTHDLDDVHQEVALALLTFRFDPSRANGASPKTVLTTIVDRQLFLVCRKLSRQRKRFKSLDAGAMRERAHNIAGRASDAGLRLDVRDLVAKLPLLPRDICHHLATGHSTHQTSQRLEVSWHVVRQWIDRIGVKFGQTGYAPKYFEGGKYDVNR